MKKHIALCSMLFLCVIVAFAQTKKPVPTPAPRPAAAPKASPYVLKKDYEAQMEELKGKINAASNAAASVRNSVAGRFNQLDVLDTQMQSVQEILNSASFQIAMNTDSLKEQRYSLETYQQKTDAQLETINYNQQSNMQMVWILFGAAAALSIIVLIVLLSMQQKSIGKLQKALNQNEEVLKKSLSLGLEKQQVSMKEELQSMESRLLLDSATLKRELTHMVNKEKEATQALVNSLQAQLTSITEQQTNEDSKPGDDPEVFM